MENRERRNALKLGGFVHYDLITPAYTLIGMENYEKQGKQEAAYPIPISL